MSGITLGSILRVNVPSMCELTIRGSIELRLLTAMSMLRSLILMLKIE
ncbi:MAG: hypothetical protein LM581_00330 [Desulfurococcales archaeon]|nr:hypothetical protein [Desulfurococcales archaeon]